MKAADSEAGVAERSGAPDLRTVAGREGLRFLDEVPDDMLDPALVAGLPVEWARSKGVLPIRCGGRACVLTSDHARVDDHHDLAVFVGQDLQVVLAPAAVIAACIERCYYRHGGSTREVLDGLRAPEAAPRPAAGADDLLESARQAPVTRLVNAILLAALKQGASDIHFEPFEARLRVRARVDGTLYEQESPPKHLEHALVSRLKVMARMDIAERRLPQDGMARVRVGEREIDIRVSTVPVAEGERVVLRLLDRDTAMLPLQALGMAERTLADFERLLAAPFGLIAVCGPTGSGKTTTLYAALGRLDARRRNILTIEEPIEYRLPDIGQMQVHPKIGLTFASGLRHILRQDPDVILVGETRDMETAEVALRASLTGHLVFTTLHTNDAPGAALRLIDMGVEPFLLASCLRGALAQRLVRRLCPACRRETAVGGRAATLAAAGCGAIDAGARVWEAAGCPACLEGYRGRIGLFELMAVDEEIREHVRSRGADAAGLRALACRRGMATLAADGVAKALAGVTTLAEVAAVASGG